MAEPKAKQVAESKTRQQRQRKQPEITASMIISVVESAMNGDVQDGVKRLKNLLFALELGTSAATRALDTLQSYQVPVYHENNQEPYPVTAMPDADEDNLPY